MRQITGRGWQAQETCSKFEPVEDLDRRMAIPKRKTSKSRTHVASLAIVRSKTPPHATTRFPLDRKLFHIEVTEGPRRRLSRGSGSGNSDQI